MRASAYLVIGAVLGAGAIGAACGSSVDTTVAGGTTASSATGNGGGASGTTVGTTGGGVAVGGSTNVAVSSVTSTATTGSGGASSNCDVACMKAETCFGVDFCGMAGIDCSSTLSMQEQCIADCGADPNTTCSNIIDCQQQCSGMTTATASSSSGAGGAGGTDCTNLCSLVQMCFNIDGCQLAGIDCSNLTPQYACVVECIDATMPSCNNLSQQVFMDCNAQCQMGTSSVSASSGMGGAAATSTTSGMGGMSATASTGSGTVTQQCQQCAGTSCSSAVGACATDSTCQQWLTCTTACNDQACLDGCDTMFASVAPLYDAIYSCTCSSCTTECAGSDPCAHVPDAG